MQLVPFDLFGFEHSPVEVLHVPALWQASLAVHTTEFDPMQLPDWHVSVWVQGLPSLHDAPFGLLGFEQVPVAGLHVPAS